MSHPRFFPRRPPRLILAALLVAGCGAPPLDRGGDRPGAQPPPLEVCAPWTAAFSEPAILVADEIRIEGPKGLLDHTVVRQDPKTTRYVARTTTEGFLQEITAQPSRGLVEIQGAIDAWSLVAFRRVVLLERPGDVPVVVRASGRAVWQDADERREEALLEFTGGR